MNIEKKLHSTANMILILFNISISMFLIIILGMIYNQTNYILGTMYYLFIPMLCLLVITYFANLFLLKEIKKYQIIKKRRLILEKCNIF